MTRARVLGVAVVVLLASTIVLAVRTVQLGRRLDHAEVYVQSGSDSVFMICTAVASALRSGDVCPRVLTIASTCMGFLTRDEAEALSAAHASRDYEAIARLIDDRLARRWLPWYEMSSSRSSLPEGYR